MVDPQDFKDLVKLVSDMNLRMAKIETQLEARAKGLNLIYILIGGFCSSMFAYLFNWVSHINSTPNPIR